MFVNMDQLTGRCVLVAGVQGPAAFSRRPLFADWKSCDDIGRAGRRPSDTGHRNLLDTEEHLCHAVKSDSNQMYVVIKHGQFGEELNKIALL